MNKKRYAALIETDVGLLIVQEKKDKEVPHLLNSLLANLHKLELDNPKFPEQSNIIQTIHTSLAMYIQTFLTSPKLSPPDNLRRKTQIFQFVYRFVQALENLSDEYKATLPPLEDIIKNINTLSIVLGGRFALPGGGMEEIDQQSPETTIIREIQEELRLRVEEIQYAFTLPGDKRTHEMYFVKAKGKLRLNLNEVSGIGFLDDKNIFPIQTTFFQGHLVWLYRKYLTSNEAGYNRADIQREFMSDLTVTDIDIKRWFVHQAHVSQLRAKTKEFEVSLPAPTDRLLIEYNRHAEQAGMPTYSSDYQASTGSSTQFVEHSQSPSIVANELFHLKIDSEPVSSDSQEINIGEIISATKIPSLAIFQETFSEFDNNESCLTGLETKEQNSKNEVKKENPAKKSDSYPRPHLSSSHDMRKRGTFRAPIIKSNQFRHQKTPKKA
jgi:ADP-ribose pyrophosphatase YjhB (NUDIX family)